MSRRVRLAVRGLIVEEGRLLLVNAWPGGKSDLLCAPGGGVEPHQSLHENLIREIHEETGLTVAVGPVAMVNEFHDPERAFHQVDIYFRCRRTAGEVLGDWIDPEGVVTERHWLTREALASRRYKPDTLPDVAWPNAPDPVYDPLELLIR